MSFILNGERETGTITYHCSTTECAMEKLQDFQQAEYRNISVLTVDDLCVVQSKFLARAEGGSDHQP